MQITVIRKSDNSVITRIFEDEEGIKEITDDDYEVLIEKANSLADELASTIKDLCSKTILSDEWRELIVEDEKTKEKLVIINSDGVEITSSDLNVRLVPKE